MLASLTVPDTISPLSLIRALTPFPAYPMYTWGWEIGHGVHATDGPERLFWPETKATRPQRSGCRPRPKPPFARVGRVRASVSVPVRVPYSPPRRSGRGGTPIPVDV